HGSAAVRPRPAQLRVVVATLRIMVRAGVLSTWSSANSVSVPIRSRRWTHPGRPRAAAIAATGAMLRTPPSIPSLIEDMIACVFIVRSPAPPDAPCRGEGDRRASPVSPRSDVLRLLMELWCFALPPPLLGKLTLLHPLQLLGIVGTEDPHLIRVLTVQLAQPPLVRHPRAPIDLHHLLVEAQARRTAVSGAIDLTAVEVRVPG